MLKFIIHNAKGGRAVIEPADQHYWRVDGTAMAITALLKQVAASDAEAFVAYLHQLVDRTPPPALVDVLANRANGYHEAALQAAHRLLDQLKVSLLAQTTLQEILFDDDSIEPISTEVVA